LTRQGLHAARGNDARDPDSSVLARPEGGCVVHDVREPCVGALCGHAGIGLRNAHLPAFLSRRPDAAWLEVHSETFLADGGPRLRALEAIRRDFPLSCHSVGISLGSAQGLDADHLRRLRALYDRLEPCLVSDHLAWSARAGTYFNDLLPLPYTDESLDAVARNIDHAQTALRRRLLVENPSRYLRIEGCRIPEPEFLAVLARRTDCRLLLDVNNVHVSAANIGIDADAYIEAFPAEFIGEIHVAGHTVCEIGGFAMLIDDHGARVSPAVWRLLERALQRAGPCPVLVEWDNRIPELPMLLGEAARAQVLLDQAMERTGALRCDA
jgi:uncharacterized protein (UPF0276 family)